MNSNKNGLDEMQKQQRDSIGNQMFLLMFWALLIGVALFPYLATVMIIIISCMSIYLVRLIASNAYLPEQAQHKKTVIRFVFIIIFSVVLGVSAVLLFKQPPAGTNSRKNVTHHKSSSRG